MFLKDGCSMVLQELCSPVYVVDKLFSEIIKRETYRFVEPKMIHVFLNDFLKETSGISLDLIKTLLENVENLHRTFEKLFKLAVPLFLKKRHWFPQGCFRWLSKYLKDVIHERDLLDVLFTFDTDCKLITVPRWKIKKHVTSCPEPQVNFLLKNNFKEIMWRENIKSNIEEMNQPTSFRSFLTKMISVLCLLQSTESVYTSINAFVNAYVSLSFAIALSLVKSNQNNQQPLKLRMYLKENVYNCNIFEKPGDKVKSMKLLKSLLNDYSFNPSNTILWVYPVTKKSIEPVLSRYMTDRRPTREETMSYELLRLCTMHDFPNPNSMSFMRLAQAGFFYTGNGNELACFSCGFKKSDWLGTDDPLEIHKEMSPDCAFFDNRRSSNTPVRYAEDTASLRLLQDHNDLEVDDTCVHCEFEHFRPMVQRTENNVSREGRNTSNNYCVSDSASVPEPPESHPGGATNYTLKPEEHQRKVKFPNYDTFQARLCTFANWNKKQIPRDLAHCGLFYTGKTDCVRCFDCGIGLKNWDPDDNPWIEHARWSSKCHYLITIKGEEFIKLVMEAAKKVEEPTAVSRTNTGFNDSEYSSTRTTDSAYATASEKVAMTEKQESVSPETTLRHSIAEPQNIEKVKQKQNESGYSSGSQLDCDAAMLRKEIKEMNDQTICKICLDSKVETVFIPCGHLVCCKKCSQSLKKCPICRKHIKQKLLAHVGN